MYLSRGATVVDSRAAIDWDDRPPRTRPLSDQDKPGDSVIWTAAGAELLGDLDEPSECAGLNWGLRWDKWTDFYRVFGGYERPHWMRTWTQSTAFRPYGFSRRRKPFGCHKGVFWDDLLDHVTRGLQVQSEHLT